MPHNFWSENDSHQEFDPIASLLSELSDPEEEEEEFRSDFFQGLEGRRRKAAFTLMLVWGIVIALHLLSWGYWLVLSFTSLLSLQALRLVFAQPPATPKPLKSEELASAPTVSLLVAAKNEELVIANLVQRLCAINYPQDKYEVWVINDNSSDRTPIILDKLAQEYPQLKVLHRGANASGGKSGALNQALSLSKGDIIGVFDADARISPDLLLQVVPMFNEAKMGAVQVRKAIANASVNFWTKGQRAEMALDSYFQQQRIALGGIGELRGNGQFVRRSALNRCGSWNEQTITDDLDLTIRLHLDNWDIGFLPFPAVEEEGVTSFKALWHQRNRWAEGGYQRYLDYWRLIISNRMGLAKTIDLLSFMLMQYLLPAAAIPDTLMVVAYHRLPVLSPLTVSMLFLLPLWAMTTGLRRTAGEKLSFSSLLFICTQTFRGMIYMLHWLLVMTFTTARMSIRPKRLKWVKTVHQGSEEGLEVRL